MIRVKTQITGLEVSYNVFERARQFLVAKGTSYGKSLSQGQEKGNKAHLSNLRVQIAFFILPYQKLSLKVLLEKRTRHKLNFINDKLNP